jgi:hypothetical protein
VISGSTDGTVRVYTLDAAELIALARARVTRSLTEPECHEYLNTSCANFNRWDPLRPITDLISRFFDQ